MKSIPQSPAHVNNRIFPEPYYEQDGITIYHADCREILPLLEPGSVDLVLTDPPYVGLTGGYDLKALGGAAAVYSEMKTVGDEWSASWDWIPDAWRIARLGMMVFCTHHGVPEVAATMPPKSRVALLTWYKRNAPPTGKNVVRYTSEFVWCFRKGVGLKWDSFTTTVLDIPNISAGIMASERIIDSNKQAVHPTQKPIELMKMLLGVGGGTILDPFMVSGTTLRAAKDLGRKAIGIEIEERYCEIAVKRLAQQVLPWEVR